MSEPDRSRAQGTGMPAADPVQLSSLVEVQTGAVVSRTLVKGKTGTVTLFAFDEGQGLSEHSAPFDAFVQILEGQADLTIGGKAIRVKAGEAILMPADVPHAVQAPGRFKMLLTMIRG
jgi:quercetin dioxygenase-like cupin family protein